MLKVLQIVRRFGPVGGMERYVWELSHSLAELDVEVHILCEQAFFPAKHNNIKVHCLGNITPKPRWISMLRFSYKVNQWIKNNTSSDIIIHSHERTNNHHITTFHSTVFAKVRQKSWWKRISIRIAVWLYLEKRELCGKQVQVVLPNSDLIAHELKQLYPCLATKLFKPAYPGNHFESTPQVKKKITDKKTILFIGQEWKRKGLEKAVQIVIALQKDHPAIEFWVLGPKPNEIQHLFTNLQIKYTLLGWQNSSSFLSKASLLLHPADAEPYGMAIAEATSFGIPVVISDKCGVASQITPLSGQVLSPSDTINQWAKACDEELNRTTTAKNISKTWGQLAAQHIEIYNQITLF